MTGRVMPAKSSLLAPPPHFEVLLGDKPSAGLLFYHDLKYLLAILISTAYHRTKDLNRPRVELAQHVDIKIRGAASRHPTFRVATVMARRAVKNGDHLLALCTSTFKAGLRRQSGQSMNIWLVMALW